MGTMINRGVSRMDDYISRKTAIDEFYGVKVDEENCIEYDIGYNDGIDFAVSRLSVLPSAAVQPARHGCFIGTEYDGYADGNPAFYEWKCSECGCIFEDDEPTYNYCPNCGARMDGKQNE